MTDPALDQALRALSIFTVGDHVWVKLPFGGREEYMGVIEHRGRIRGSVTVRLLLNSGRRDFITEIPYDLILRAVPRYVIQKDP
jgi:hypothetical protein